LAIEKIGPTSAEGVWAKPNRKAKRIGGVMEDDRAAITAIEHVVPHLGDGGSCSPGHDLI
jgi:hypothetical protein